MQKEKEEFVKSSIDKLADTAVEIFNKEGKYVLTFFLLFENKKKEKGLAVLNIANETDYENRKFDIVKTIGETIRKEMKVENKMNIGKIDAVAMVSEAWVSIVPNPKKEEFKKLEYIRPRDDPNRKEALVIACMEESGKCMHKMFLIDRTDKEKTKLSVYGEGATEASSSLLAEFWNGFLVKF